MDKHLGQAQLERTTRWWWLAGSACCFDVQGMIAIKDGLDALEFCCRCQRTAPTSRSRGTRVPLKPDASGYAQTTFLWPPFHARKARWVASNAPKQISWRHHQACEKIPDSPQVWTNGVAILVVAPHSFQHSAVCDVYCVVIQCLGARKESGGVHLSWTDADPARKRWAKAQNGPLALFQGHWAPFVRNFP